VNLPFSGIRRCGPPPPGSRGPELIPNVFGTASGRRTGTRSLAPYGQKGYTPSVSKSTGPYQPTAPEALIVFFIQVLVPAIAGWGVTAAPDSILLAPLCCLAMMPYLLRPKLRACRLFSRFAYLAFISIFLFDLASLWIHFSNPRMLLNFTLAMSPTLLFGHLVFRKRT